MEFVQAAILFVLGVGAAFLAYFAWHHTNAALGITSTSVGPNVTYFPSMVAINPSQVAVNG